MTDPIYHRQSNDTARSWQAFQDYLRLPPAIRSVPTLHKLYVQQYQDSQGIDQAKPPTRAYSTIEGWHAHNNWLARAAAYDKDQHALLEEFRTAAKVETFKTRAEREQAEAEEFRATMLENGRNMIAFASGMLEIIKPVADEIQERGNPMTDKDLDRLMKVSNIYRCISATVPPGCEMWAQALGIDQALGYLREKD